MWRLKSWCQVSTAQSVTVYSGLFPSLPSMKWKVLFLTFTLSVQPSLLSNCREQQTRSVSIPPSWFLVNMLSHSLCIQHHTRTHSSSVSLLFLVPLSFPHFTLCSSLLSASLLPSIFAHHSFLLFSVFLSFSPPFLALLLCRKSFCARLTEMQSWSPSNFLFLFFCFSFFPPSSWNRPLWKQIKGA